MKLLFPLLLLILVASACTKHEEWLDVKRSKNDVVPSSLKDLQAILDNTTAMNQNYAQLGLDAADNNYITDANLKNAAQTERNAYLWKQDVFQGATSFDWLYAYQMVEYANVVLDGLRKITPDQNTNSTYNNIMGSALFYRSMAFYQLAQLYCRPYDASNAQKDPGIPLRLTSDVNIPSVRSSVAETYNQILNDLKTAVKLLPVTPLYTTRPSSVAANALLAKVLLSTENYAEAGIYANLVLEKFNALLDFKSSSVSTALTYRFPVFKVGNPEVIFYASTGSKATLSPTVNGTGYTNDIFYASYSQDDLRKTVFYQNYGNGKIKFQGTYTGINLNFAGIATNEIYLIRAECYARAGQDALAMRDLNTLLKQRYSSPYTDLTATNAEDALQRVLQERRKELPYTGQLRWEDLRRLNKYPRFAQTLQRNFDGETYTLSPEDKRYVFPIPDLEISLYGLQQNER